MRLVGLWLCAMFFAASTAFAQFDTAAVLGTVRDGSGAVVPSAKVTLTAVETGISIVRASGGDGNYEFAAVKPGRMSSPPRRLASRWRLWMTCRCRLAHDFVSTCRCRLAS